MDAQQMQPHSISSSSQLRQRIQRVYKYTYRYRAPYGLHYDTPPPCGQGLDVRYVPPPLSLALALAISRRTSPASAWLG